MRNMTIRIKDEIFKEKAKIELIMKEENTTISNEVQKVLEKYLDKFNKKYLRGE